MHEENIGVWFSLEEIDGVPQSVISRFKKGADPTVVELLKVQSRIGKIQGVEIAVVEPYRKQNRGDDEVVRVSGIQEVEREKRHRTACKSIA